MIRLAQPYLRGLFVQEASYLKPLVEHVGVSPPFVKLQSRHNFAEAFFGYDLLARQPTFRRGLAGHKSMDFKLDHSPAIPRLSSGNQD